MNVLRHCFRRNFSLRARPVPETIAEIRTRFHRKPTTECWSLAASDSAPVPPGTIKTLLQTYECKTGIYNMLAG